MRVGMHEMHALRVVAYQILCVLPQWGQVTSLVIVTFPRDFPQSGHRQFRSVQIRKPAKVPTNRRIHITGWNTCPMITTTDSSIHIGRYHLTTWMRFGFFCVLSFIAHSPLPAPLGRRATAGRPYMVRLKLEAGRREHAPALPGAQFVINCRSGSGPGRNRRPG